MEWTLGVAGPCDVGKCGEVTIDISEANACTTTTGVVVFFGHMLKTVGRYFASDIGHKLPQIVETNFVSDCSKRLCLRLWTQTLSQVL